MLTPTQYALVSDNLVLGPYDTREDARYRLAMIADQTEWIILPMWRDDLGEPAGKAG